ncbi:MAG TPA: exosortase U, partial [Pirellulales bacterium]|nr:exosortase U [Pirellulales bacterium]
MSQASLDPHAASVAARTGPAATSKTNPAPPSATYATTASAVAAPEAVDSDAEPMARPIRLVDARWAIIMPALLAAASAPLLYLHFSALIPTAQYGYVPLIAVGAAVLAWQRLPDMGHLLPGLSSIFVVMMGVAVTLQLMAIVLFLPSLAMIAFLVALMGLTYGIGGGPLARRMFPVWLFAWFMIPLPFDWDNQLVTSLQSLTATWSSRLLDTFGIMHLLAGNTVELPGKRLFVEEACSGVQSLFACMAATAFFVIWSHYGYWRSAILLVSAFGWVLVANATRVFTVTWLSSIGIDAVEGLPHTLLGLGVFALTLALMFSTDRLIEFFLSHRLQFWRRKAARGPAPEPTHFLPVRQTLLGSWPSIPLSGIYGAFLLLQLVLMVPLGASANGTAIEDGAPASFALLNQKSLPVAWLGRPMTDFGSDVDRVFKSVHSRFWTYGMGRNRIYASIDFPFPKWHDLSICYRGLGWTIDSKLYNPPVTSDDLPFYELEMSQSPMGYGFLVFFLFDPQGKPMMAPSEDFVVGMRQQVSDRAAHMRSNWRAGGQEIVGDGTTSYVQVQVFVSSLAPITETE